jgi:hypothetical protein
MYTTVIHPLRKALNLSVNEYCLLEAIRNLANKKKYNYYCVMSKQGLADGLDVSRRFVHKSISMFLLRGFIEKNNKGHVRTSDAYNELFDIDNIKVIGSSDILSIDLSFFSEDETPESTEIEDCAQSAHYTVQKVHTDCAQSAHYTNSNTDMDTDKIKNKKIFNPSPESSADAVIVFTPNSEPSVETKKKEERKSSAKKKEDAASSFLSTFNIIKEKVTGKPSRLKVMSKTAMNNLKIVQANYSSEDIAIATLNMLNAEWPRKTNNQTPDHLLAIANFNRYLSEGPPVSINESEEDKEFNRLFGERK